MSALLAAARKRTLNTRTMMTRPASTIAQSRAGQPAVSTSRHSYAQRLASLQPTAPRSSVASRQFQRPSYQRSSSWRTGQTVSRASRLAQVGTSRRPLTSASSRYDAIMRNSFSRTSTSTARQTTQSRPVATSLKRVDGGLHIQWTSRSGARYQVQGSSDLNQWTNVGSARGGMGGRDSMKVNSVSGGPRYYRVVQVD